MTQSVEFFLSIVIAKIIKAGFAFGGSYRQGELFKGSKVKGYYNARTGSWELQAGVRSYDYATFLMIEKAVNCLRETKGWEIGIGPTVVVVDEGALRICPARR